MNRFSTNARFVALFVAIAGASNATLAQISGISPGLSYAGAGGVTVLPGTNTSGSASVAGGTFTSRFTGEMITSLLGNQTPGTYNGQSYHIAIVPFTVGALPVRIGTASMHANFKMVASGGNGIGGGNDPIINVSILSRLYQQTGASPSAGSDPWLSAIEFNKTWTQNGNGLQVIDTTFGPATSNYILTPGTYYMYQYLNVTTAYTTNGGVQPQRGATVEYGGDLTNSTYSGFTYTFDWQTVPTPGSAALFAAAGLIAVRRKQEATH